MTIETTTLRARAADRPGVDYRRLLGQAAWLRLPAAVRHRFSRAHTAEITYVGRFDEVRASRVGRVLAQLARLIGEPLVPLTGRGVPASVRVFPCANGGTVWERAYHFAGRPTRLVRSAKRLDRDGTLLECLGGGLFMRLAVTERDGALEFRSAGYFWELLGLRVTLPERWGPGETVVTHRDCGGGRFRFTLTITHPWLGLLVHQDGEFQERETWS